MSTILVSLNINIMIQDICKGHIPKVVIGRFYNLQKALPFIKHNEPLFTSHSHYPNPIFKEVNRK